MRFRPLITEIIAITAIVIIPTVKTINAMQTNTERSPITEAANWQTKIFVVSIILAVVGAIATAIIATLLFRAGNAYQDAVKHEADTQIALAKTEADKANAETARLNVEVERVKKERAETDLKAEEAKERAAKAELKAGEIEQQNLKLRIDLKSEKRRRGKLENHLEPRKLWHSRIIIEKLQKYKGTLYILEYLPHPAALAAAELIDPILQEANWKRLGAFPNPYNPPNGVQVATRGFKNTPENFFGTRASKVFASYLKANKWHVMDIVVNIPGYWGHAEKNLGADKIPDNTVKIFVGLKPDWYFGEKFSEEMYEARKKEAEREGNPVREPAWLDDHNEWISELETEELEKLRKEWGLF